MKNQRKGRAAGPAFPVACGRALALLQASRIEASISQSDMVLSLRPGRGGCPIYEIPPECRDIYCAWLMSPALGPEWRPNRCKMFVRYEGNLLAIHVDPSDP